MTTTHYIWDEENDSYFMETDGDGNVTAVYTNEPVPYGRVISQRRGDETSFYHYDGQGSTRQLTDESGNVTDEYTYSAFGETVARSGARMNPFCFSGAYGYYSDADAVGVYIRSRVYAPPLARWTTVDANGFGDGPNCFVYVLNNPPNAIDPAGSQFFLFLPGTFLPIIPVRIPAELTAAKFTPCGGYDTDWRFRWQEQLTNSQKLFLKNGRKVVISRLVLGCQVTECKLSGCSCTDKPGSTVTEEEIIYEVIVFDGNENPVDHNNFLDRGPPCCSTHGKRTTSNSFEVWWVPEQKGSEMDAWLSTKRLIFLNFCGSNIKTVGFNRKPPRGFGGVPRAPNVILGRGTRELQSEWDCCKNPSWWSFNSSPDINTSKAILPYKDEKKC